MTFKDIKQNFPIYILDKTEVKFIKGKVTGTTFPRADKQQDQSAYNMGQVQFQQQPPARMVVDLTIEADNRTATYTVGENASINYANNLIIATDPSLLVSEIEAIKNSADQGLEPTYLETLKKRRERSVQLLSEISPQFKQQQEYDARFARLEKNQDELKDLLTNFIKEFKS